MILSFKSIYLWQMYYEQMTQTFKIKSIKYDLVKFFKILTYLFFLGVFQTTFMMQTPLLPENGIYPNILDNAHCHLLQNHLE